MVEHRDAIGALGRRVQALGGVAQLLGAERSALVAVGARRVQADDVERASVENVGSVVSHCRSNSAQGRVNRAGKV